MFAFVMSALSMMTYQLIHVPNHTNRSLINFLVANTKIRENSIPIAPSRYQQEPKASTEKIVSQQMFRKIVTVQIVNGEQKGSGLLIRNRLNRILVATNRHVVGDSDSVCVVFPNNKILPGFVYKTGGSKNDLAFISIPALPVNSPYALPSVITDPQNVRFIVSTGYSALTNKFIETSGVTIPILGSIELQSGYSLTYSNQIEKGMSGGGIFTEDGKLIGLNAIHSDPLWSSDWFEVKGTRLNDDVSRKLDSVSVGISSQLLLSELNQLKIESTKETKQIPCSNKINN